MSAFGSVKFTTNQSNNYAICSDSNFVKNKTNCSYSIWFKRANAVMDTSDGILYGDVAYDTGHGGIGSLVYSTTGVQTGAVSSELFRNDGGSFARVTGTTNVCNNAWHSLVMTFDKAVGFKWYIDGVLESVSTDGGSPNVDYTASENFGLGNASNLGNTMIDANLALFQVWTATTLSSTDAAAITAGGTSVQSPTASWSFNEGSGTVATDSVGSKTLTFQGTNTAFVWSTDVPAVLAGASAKKKASTNLVF